MSNNISKTFSSGSKTFKQTAKQYFFKGGIFGEKGYVNTFNQIAYSQNSTIYKSLSLSLSLYLSLSLCVCVCLLIIFFFHLNQI